MDPRSHGCVSCNFIGEQLFQFGNLILDVSLCTVIEAASCVLGVGWKSAFAELFVFALGGPTAPTGVERRSFG